MQAIDQLPDIGLIEHILTHYHDRHRAQLPELIRLSKRVELVHGGVPACPAGLTALLEKLQEDLFAHMDKEEEILFPMIARQLGAAVMRPVDIMRHDHAVHIELLEEIRALTANITAPVGACSSWRTLYAGLAQFTTDLMEHIHLENDVLFARIDALAPGARASAVEKT